MDYLTKALSQNNTLNLYKIDSSSLVNNNLWKVHLGLRKTTNIPAKDSILPTPNKQTLDRITEVLKKEITTLTKLRHPNLLSITEPMEDSRLSISFATESIQFTLHHAVKSNLLDELDIQNGILQLIRAIQFIHTANIIHTNINLNSIYINRNGDWKISGLGFSQSCVGQTTSVSLEFLKHYPPFCSPILDFISPEYVFEEYICFSSDVYSLGLLISALYNSGASPLNCNENLHLYKQLASSRLDFGKVPNGLYQLVERMVQRDPKYRIGLNELSESSYFNNILVGTIKFLDSFVEKTQIEKAQFLKGLGKILPQFSNRLLEIKVLPALLDQLKDKLLAPFILPCIFLIADKQTPEDFVRLTLPQLKPVFSYNDPPQSMILLLSRMDLFLSKLPDPESFKRDIMPLLYTGLETSVPQVQEQALKSVNQVLKRLDFSQIKSVLLSKLITLYTTSSILGIRINSLIALFSLIKHLDKFLIVEKILPMLKVNQLRDAGLLLSILAIYDESAKILDKDSIAQLILPEIWKIALDTLFSVDQFNKFKLVIVNLSSRVIEMQLKHLENISNLNYTASKVDFDALVTGVNNLDVGDSFISERRESGQFQINLPASLGSSGNLAGSNNMQNSSKVNVTGYQTQSNLVNSTLTNFNSNQIQSNLVNSTLTNFNSARLSQSSIAPISYPVHQTTANYSISNYSSVNQAQSSSNYTPNYNLNQMQTYPPQITLNSNQPNYTQNNWNSTGASAAGGFSNGILQPTPAPRAEVKKNANAYKDFDPYT